MKEKALSQQCQETSIGSGFALDQSYCSVEFAVDGADYLRQFRLWNMEPEVMCVLIKETSEVVECLKVGDTMKMKYYSEDALCPPQYLETEIRRITKEDQGRFRGHYVVGLSIRGDSN
jgi:hypothetical protein